jgi:hypothetical protein
MSCVCFYTDPGSVYPVIDPLRASATPLPQIYGYGFAWDWVSISVDNDLTLAPGGCKMRIVLMTGTGVTAPKSIAAWNYCTNSQVSSVSTSGADHGPHEMIVDRGSCFGAVDTLLLIKPMAFNVMTGMYTLKSDDLWAYWGGKKVTFTWREDSFGSGIWGGDTPTPTYPIGRSSFVVGSVAQPITFFMVVGGAKFKIRDAAEATALGQVTAGAPRKTAAELAAIPSAPVDFTLLRELNSPRVFVTFGGAKFWIPSPAALAALGYRFGQVNVVPDNTLAAVPDAPRDGTLLKEQSDPRVFLAAGAGLRWIIAASVFERLCFSWRNVRVVPDGALTSLARGADLT